MVMNVNVNANANVNTNMNNAVCEPGGSWGCYRTENAPDTTMRLAKLSRTMAGGFWCISTNLLFRHETRTAPAHTRRSMRSSVRASQHVRASAYASQRVRASACEPARASQRTRACVGSLLCKSPEGKYKRGRTRPWRLGNGFLVRVPFLFFECPFIPPA